MGRKFINPTVTNMRLTLPRKNIKRISTIIILILVIRNWCTIIKPFSPFQFCQKTLLSSAAKTDEVDTHRKYGFPSIVTVIHPCTHHPAFLLILLAPPPSSSCFCVLFYFLSSVSNFFFFFMLSFSNPLRKENISESGTWFPFPGVFAFSAEMRRLLVINGTVKGRREKEGERG